MSLKEQISAISRVAQLTDEALHSVTAVEVHLKPLAKAIAECPDLLHLIQITADVPPQPAPVMSNTGVVDLGELAVHVNKIVSTSMGLRRTVEEIKMGALPADKMLEPIDALHKLVALLPMAGPAVEADLTNAFGQLANDLKDIPFKKFAGGPEISLTAAPGYEQLVEVLAAAHDQAAYGKGKERHANGLPFHKQRMQGISDLVGSPDGMLYQLVKKTTEGLQFENPEKREHELLGAINYLAGIVIWLRRHEATDPVGI